MKSLRCFRWWVLLALLPLATYGQALVVTQRLALTAAADGIDGQLEILTDARLTHALREQMWGIGEWNDLVKENTPQYQDFTARPPRHLIVRIRRSTGETVFIDSLDQPLARAAAAHLHGQYRTLLVTVDYEFGIGSYSGPQTSLLERRADAFQWAGSPVRANFRLRLSRTLKTDWQIAHASHPASGRDILSVECHPNWDGDPDQTVIDYLRYHFEGQQWRRYRRTRSGYWDAESDFPPKGRFPVVPVPHKRPAGAPLK